MRKYTTSSIAITYQEAQQAVNYLSTTHLYMWETRTTQHASASHVGSPFTTDNIDIGQELGYYAESHVPRPAASHEHCEFLLAH